MPTKRRPRRSVRKLSKKLTPRRARAAAAGLRASRGRSRPESRRPAKEFGERGAGRRLTKAADLGERGYTAGGRPPAPDLSGVPPVRLTAYLRPDQVLRLRAEAASRQARGERADVSALLRAAVDLLLGRSAQERRKKSK